ncbi:hypothetical protein ON010_g8527 [Phytophthora cinnamomi]|nr:hypothetical protein ON010_g8527 [Phytophthora cinnamomi]
MGTNRDDKLLRRARKRLDHLHDIAEGQKKRRKVLQQRRSQQLEQSMQSRKYELTQPSWSALGKVLLEAFEDGNRDEEVDVLRAAVQIHVSYEQVEKESVEEKEEEEEEGEKEETGDKEEVLDEEKHVEEDLPPPPAKRPKHKEVAKVSAALETSLSTGVSDNDTQDSGIQLSDLLEFPPRRRKSRRNEERLREEHAAAVKKAREKDLAYRLGAFLPDAVGDEERESTPESVSIEWLPPLDIKLVDAKFRVSNASKEIIAQIPPFAFPSSTEGSAIAMDSQSSQKSSRDRTASREAPSHAELVTGKRISEFVSDCDGGDAPSRGVMDWVRHYLNQCGRWAHLKLGTEDENIHIVCTWLEKVLKGELDVARTPRGITQSSVINVADHSLVQGSRFEGNGLTLAAQLFLLELHFDMLLQQPVRGKRRRKLKKAVENQLAQAQKLLFEFGWLEDSEEATDCPTGSDFLRLLWLIARMYERCGNPQMAQQYFSKCREKLLELSERGSSHEDDGEIDDFRVKLPNQKADNEITVEILDEKISGLRFSDVCSEAQRLFEAGYHDQVVSVLLGHFFPANQAPRMMDFLNEFEVDEDDSAVRGDNNKKRFKMVLESLGQSSTYTDEDSILFLLTALYYVIDFLDGLAVTKEPTTLDDSPDEACTNALTALDFLLTELTQNHCGRIATNNHWILLRALSVRCLKPSILLRFDSPSDVLSMVRVTLEVNEASSDGDNDPQMIGVDAMARLLYVIRSLSSENFRNLFTLVPHPVKRKQPRRDRIRVFLVELLRFLNRSFHGNEKLALSLPLPKRSALMTLCCTLMKEEEETVAGSDGKTPRQLFGNGAILFVLLFESFRQPDLTASLPQLVELIHLLHERLGQHGICGLAYFSELRSSPDSGKTSCFLESCTLLLSKFVNQKASVREDEKSAKISDDGSAEDDDEDEDEDEEEAEYCFQKEMCQCYRCLYDVQILSGTDDHKTGATFASLQNAEQYVRHQDALRLTRFAVPILLATKPKNNGQKKERLKLLYAVRDALADSNFAALSAQPASVSPPLEAYLAPKGLLQEEIPPPFPLDAGTTATSADEACLGHLWYLMGANFILGRVKRRGNLGELMDMEQQVRERVEFLMKDVLYYHPDRIDSWIRLGKTMKELYHAATDAFAAVLGQKLRIQALRWYTAKIFVEDSSQQELSFDNVVLDWSLFKKMKGWESKGTDGHKPGKVSTSKDFKEETKKYTDQSQPATGRIPIEVFATTYIAQVIEFARRCFDMAARLAEEATKTHKMKLQSQSDSAGEDAEGEGDDFDEKLDELHSKSIECNEECGLLLYNVLQEFSLMKELNAALFPLTVYSRLLEKTLVYFREGLAICESNDDAHEDHFRLQYMIGKTLKKKRWCELRRQDLSDPDALSTATEMASCFAKAEAARDEGDREHALVHAFYSLQALRIDLTISESPSVAALRLVCNHFYEEEEEEKDDDEEGDDESADSDLTKATDEKSSSEENVASPASEVSATKASSKTTSDIKSASSTKKDEILALLSDTGSDDDIRELNVTLARGWLALNIIEALESIPDEDRYFHPSRYVLARLVYWLSTFYSVLGQSGYTDDTVSALLGAIQARRNEEKVEGPSDAAARALKEMAPIFDKRRPQIVAIWFSEYIPSAKKFEELNQRQMKYDYYRLKYWRFYIALLQENEAYARLKEVGSWVLACKEEHDVIDIMLGMVLHARGKVLRSRLQAFFNTIEGASTGKSGVDTLDMMTQTQLAGEDRPVDALLKQLAKTYSYYLEVSNAQQRLSHIMDDSSLLVENAELPMVTLFFVGAITYPSEMPLLEKDTVILDREFNANIIVIKNALRRDELPPRIYDAQGRETWKAYLDAARSFCEEKWPERSGKGKPSKKHSRPKAVTVAAPTTASSTDAVAVNKPKISASSCQQPARIAQNGGRTRACWAPAGGSRAECADTGCANGTELERARLVGARFKLGVQDAKLRVSDGRDGAAAGAQERHGPGARVQVRGQDRGGGRLWLAVQGRVQLPRGPGAGSAHRRVVVLGPYRSRKEWKLKAEKLLKDKGEDRDGRAIFTACTRAVSVTNDMVMKLIAVLRRMNITFYVAPYEADAQLAFMSRQKIVDVVISDDSDCVPYGVKTALFKLSPDGWGSELKRRSLGANEELSFVGWTEEMFIQLCVLAGCDYCPSVSGVGIITAYKLVSQYKTPTEVLAALQKQKGSVLPDNFAEHYCSAILTYRHQLVFDPRDAKLKMLSPLDASKDILPRVDKGLHFLGNVELRDDVVAFIASGQINPVTHESYVWKDTAAAVLLEEERQASSKPRPKSSRTRSSTSSESSGMVLPHQRQAESSQEDPIASSRRAQASTSRVQYEKPRPSSHSSWTHLDSVLGSSDHIVNFRSPKVSENFKPLAALHEPPVSIGSSSITAHDLKDFESRPVRSHVQRVRNPANRRRDGKGSGFEGEVLCKVDSSSLTGTGVAAASSDVDRLTDEENAPPPQAKRPRLLGSRRPAAPP